MDTAIELNKVQHASCGDCDQTRGSPHAPYCPLAKAATAPVDLRDIVGIPFALGDKVATDTMSYRSSSLRMGTVTEVKQADRYGPQVKVTYHIGGETKAGKPCTNSVWRRPGGVVKVAA